MSCLQQPERGLWGDGGVERGKAERGEGERGEGASGRGTHAKTIAGMSTPTPSARPHILWPYSMKKMN